MIIYKKLVRLLTNSDRKKAIFLFSMTLLMAFLDVIGASSIMPFMAVAVSPEIIESNALLAFLYEHLGGYSQKEFLWFLGASTFILLLTSLTFRALISYLQIQFVLSCECSIGQRLIESYISQSYIWFLGRHTGELAKGVLSDVSSVVNGLMMPILVIAAHSLSIIAFLLMLLFVNFKLTVVMGLMSFFIGFILFKGTKRYLTKIGVEHQRANQERFTAINEVFGAVKEVKFGCLESVYIQKFLIPSRAYAKYQASSQVVAQLPRYVLEGIAFGGMLLVLLVLMQKNNVETALPTFSLYAFAGYRIVPAIQQIYGCLSMIHFNMPKLNMLSEEINNLKSNIHNRSNEVKLEFEKNIQICDVWFTYPNSSSPALKGLNLNIVAGTKVALVGATGGGKTTTADIILGLISPSKGSLKVDGKQVDEEFYKAWRRLIGYVPQQIFLSDQSIASNIAFGVESSMIDQERMRWAAKIAHIHDFIIDDLPNGYATAVGERGVRLSGGQRQRIGIARALYLKPKLLVLDEATSALDNLTEQAVLSSINSCGDIKFTTIMIAHRLSTIRNCDQIYFLDNGAIIDVGCYEDLMQRNAEFKGMVNSLKT